MIWNYSIEEITKGYIEKENEYDCLLCEVCYRKGSIYSIEEQLYDAYGAIVRHKLKAHGTTAEYLLAQDNNLLGISEIQQQILSMMAKGCQDKEIAKELGIAASTVRNHRFKLREKEKQAKLYLAMMQSLEKKTNSSIAMTDQGEVTELHMSATMVDDRYSITEQERKKTLATYMDDNGALKQFPAKEKKKIIILKEIMNQFKKNTDYSESEVNKVLKRIFEEDYPTLRRALIEYGFMERSNDCMRYRVKE